MPHAIIKMYAGRSEQQKKSLADAVSKAIMAATGHGEEAVSVSIQDIEPSDWADTVYRPDILEQPNTLYKKPGYNPFRS